MFVEHSLKYLGDLFGAWTLQEDGGNHPNRLRIQQLIIGPKKCGYQLCVCARVSTTD